MPRIENLFIYPVKSCGTIPLTSVEIGPQGFLNDRRWIIVDGAGEKLTQREQPRLARVDVILADGALTLSSAGHGSVTISVDERPTQSQRVNVWGDDSPGLIEHGGACDWISSYLGLEAKILRFDDGDRREVGETWGGTSGATIQFPDCTPLHVTTLSSLAALNEWRREEGIGDSPMDRFRPNIVLSGTEAWEEDSWPALSGPNGIRLDVVRPTSRCRTTLVDQGTADVEANGNLHVLTKHRLFKNYVGRPGAFFGVQTLVEGCSGKRLQVGDELEICEQGQGLPGVPRLF